MLVRRGYINAARRYSSLSRFSPFMQHLHTSRWATPSTPLAGYELYLVYFGFRIGTAHLIVHEALRSLPLSEQYPRRQQRLRLRYRRSNMVKDKKFEDKSAGGSRERHCDFGACACARGCVMCAFFLSFVRPNIV